MAASWREGEDLPLLQAWQQALQRPAPHGQQQPLAPAMPTTEEPHALPPRPLLLMVPRHPQRFEEVHAALCRAGLSVSRRSTWGPAGPSAEDWQADAWLGDSVGEMPAYYAIADAALLGGSFAPLGGQNLIEAAACGCPVVMGPHTFNFLEAAEQAEAAGAALRVADMPSGVQAALALVTDTAAQERMSAAAQTFLQAHQGAARRVAGLVQGML